MVTEIQPGKSAAEVGVTASPRRKKGRTRAVLAALAVALVLGGGYLAWSKWLAPADASAQYAIAVAQRGDLEDVVTATGTLQPRDFVDVGTQVSGQLRKLHVEVGAVVKQGDLLAEIDPTVFKARVDADLAQLANLRAQLTDREEIGRAHV